MNILLLKIELLMKWSISCSPDNDSEPPLKKVKSENGSENTGIISDMTEEVKKCTVFFLGVFFNHGENWSRIVHPKLETFF